MAKFGVVEISIKPLLARKKEASRQNDFKVVAPGVFESTIERDGFVVLTRISAENDVCPILPRTKQNYLKDLRVNPLYKKSPEVADRLADRLVSQDELSASNWGSDWMTYRVEVFAKRAGVEMGKSQIDGMLGFDEVMSDTPYLDLLAIEAVEKGKRSVLTRLEMHRKMSANMV